MSSLVYTVGTALSRAQDSGVPVAVLVEGHWVHGHVEAVDSHGVLLTARNAESWVVRMERVSAVRVHPPSGSRPDRPQPARHSDSAQAPAPMAILA